MFSDMWANFEGMITIYVHTTLFDILLAMISITIDENQLSKFYTIAQTRQINFIERRLICLTMI